MDDSKPESPPDGVTFALAFAGTVLVLCVLFAGLAVLWANKRGADARKGWNLAPAWRAARDLEPGVVLTGDDLKPGTLPEQFVTDSLAKPAQAAAILGHPLKVPMQRGDALWLAYLDPPSELILCPGLVQEAARALHAADDADVRAFLREVERATPGFDAEDAP